MYDICIVGAGIAGASLAAVLGKKGFHVALIDRRWTEPDEIIGELLQPGGVDKLSEMGLADALTNIDAQPINGYAIFLQKEWITLDYDQRNTSVKHTGFGFRYGRFVQSLRKQCRRYKNINCIEGNVAKILGDNQKIEGVILRKSKGEDQKLFAKLTIICQGSLSPLAKSLNNSNVDTKGFMLGLILKKCDLPFKHSGHIILADPAPVLCYPVGKDKIRVLIDFPSEVPAPKGAARAPYLLKKILPQMPLELQDAFKKAVEEGGFKVKSTSLLASRPIAKEGVLLLGDSLNIRHPVTGGGMTVALTDVKAFAEQLNHPSDLDQKPALKEIIRNFYHHRHSHNATINILSFALYRIFRHDLLKKACFDYLQKGGVNSVEPMSLLSGVSRSRFILYKHFFAVAGYALMYRNKLQNGSAHVGVIKSIGALVFSVKILIPLIIAEIPRIYRDQDTQ